MSVITITISDADDGTVDIKAEFEPKLKKMTDAGELSQAEYAALFCIEKLADRSQVLKAVKS